MVGRNYPALKRYLLAMYSEEIRDCTPIDYKDLLRTLEHCWGGYAEGKQGIVTLWRGYRDEMQPLFSLVTKWAPVEVDSCFREARGEEVFRFSDVAHNWS